MIASDGARTALRVASQCLKFLVLGPAFGGLLFWIGTAVGSIVMSHETPPIESLFSFVLLAYPLGFAPAAMAGFGFGLVERKVKGRARLLLAGAIGFASTGVCITLVRPSPPLAYLVFGLLGFLAAIAVAVAVATDDTKAEAMRKPRNE